MIIIYFSDPLDEYLEVNGWSFSPEKYGRRPIGAGTVLKPQPGDASFSRESDSLSPDFYRHLAAGTPFKTVIVSFYGGPKNLLEFQYSFTDVFINYMNTSRKRESVGFNFDSSEMKYYADPKAPKGF